MVLNTAIDNAIYNRWMTSFLVTLVVLLICVSTVFTSTVFASGDPRSSILRIDANFRSASLASYVQYYKDVENSESIETIITNRKTAFRAYRNPRYEQNFGASNATYWFFFRVANPDSTAADGILEFSNPILDDVQVYYFENKSAINKNGFAESSIGQIVEHAPSSIKSHLPTVLLPFAPNSSYDVYVKATSRYYSYFPLTLYTRAAYYARVSQIQAINGILLGITLGLLAYHFVLFIKTGRAAYVSYLVVVFLVAMNLLVTDNYLYLLWPAEKNYNSLLYLVLPLMTQMFLIQFARNFFDTANFVKQIDYIFKFSMLMFCCVILVISLNIKIKALSAIVDGLYALAAALTVVVALEKLRRGFKPARLFLLASLISYSAMGTVGFFNLGHILLTNSQVVILQYGELFSAMIFALALVSWNGHFALLDAGKNLRSKRKATNVVVDEKTKSRLLNRIGHEIRTPMNGVMGTVELLLETQLSDIQRQQLNIISSSSRLLLTLVNDMLDYSRLEEGGIVLEQDSFDLRDVFVDCSELFKLEAEEKGLRFLCYIDNNVPLKLVGDAGRLRQIVLNLLSNAFKFTQEGNIVLSCSLDESRLLEHRFDVARNDSHSNDSHRNDAAGSIAGRTVLVFEVNDTGLGIDKTLQKVLLGKKIDTFAQDKDAKEQDSHYQSDLDNPNQKTLPFMRRGAGLGLSICKELVNLMHGTLGIESVPGIGSSFWFTIPVTLDSSPEAADDNKKYFALEHKQLLWIDEHLTYGYKVRDWLSQYSMQVEIFSDAYRALSFLKRTRTHFDIICVNKEMINMSGSDVLKQIRQIFASRTLHIIDDTWNANELMDVSGMTIMPKTVLLTPINYSTPINYVTPINSVTPIDCAEGGVNLARDKTADTNIDLVVAKPSSIPEIATLLCGLYVNAVQPEYSPATHFTERCLRIKDIGLILVAEDDLVNQKIVSSMLNKMGCDILLAENGVEAVELYRQYSGVISLVLMDCQMPILNGYQATKQIRAIEAQQGLKAIPIVAISAYVSPEYYRQSIDVGMDGYINKPLSLESLLQVIEKYCLVAAEKELEALV